MKLEKIFEGLLWDSRFVVLVAVIASLLASFSMFYIATVDAYYLFCFLFVFVSPALEAEQRNALRSETITHVVEIVDGYLLETVMLIFGLGLYELFISKIDKAEESEGASNVLLIHSLDDLKGRLAKVILMILIVKFFEHSIRMPYALPIVFLFFAAGIALIGLSLYLSHAADKPQH